MWLIKQASVDSLQEHGRAGLAHCARNSLPRLGYFEYLSDIQWQPRIFFQLAEIIQFVANFGF